MNNLIIPKDYRSALNLHDTQIGIKTVKDFFQVLLAEELLKHEIDEEGLAARRKRFCDTDPLYAIFTSGSTGGFV